MIECELCINHKKLTTIALTGQVDNSEILLGDIFALLDQAAVIFDISEAKIRPDDIVFSIITTGAFKNACNTHLSRLFVWIMRPILEIRCAVKKRHLLQTYHEARVLFGRYG